jgi:MFS family permease
VTAVSARDGGPLPGVPAAEVPAADPRPHGSGFWAVAFAFLIVMAVATLPSPLYGLYRTRDHLSALTITVVFAIFAGSTIAILQRDSSVAARIGRRGMMLAAVATMMLAMAVLAAWKDLPGLLIGRLVTGVSVGLAAGIAITYLVELRLRADPKASVVQARTIGTSVTIGALGVGPLIAGCLAQWVPQPLTVTYLVFVALGVVALAGLRTAPETGAPTPRAATRKQPAGSRRTVRLPVPAAAATLAAFAANGLFAGLSGLFLATTLHQHSLALSGTSGIVLEASPQEIRVAMTSDLLIALYVGLSVPVIGAGVALDLGASAPNTVLGFAILVGLGVVASGWALLGRRP